LISSSSSTSSSVPFILFDTQHFFKPSNNGFWWNVIPSSLNPLLKQSFRLSSYISCCVNGQFQNSSHSPYVWHSLWIACQTPVAVRYCILGWSLDLCLD
jgi:hypothetical protein